MKPGLSPGYAEEFTVLVTPEMSPHFDGQLIHPVYSTWWVVHHFELAGRRVLVPFLEDHEEGVGGGINIQHRSPAMIGTTVKIRAVVTSCDKNRLVCACTATVNDRLLAEAEFLQVILPKSKLESLLRRVAADINPPQLVPPAFQSLLQ
jgi:fluoroacetyl-CoA thioesterase